jgi:putative ABC transport system permease protein
MDIGSFLSMMISVTELACIYALVVLGLVFSFRMVGFADLTIESSFTTGAAISAIMLMTTSVSPLATVIAAAFVGAMAGTITSLLHIKGKVSRLLSGIIVMTVLYSVNLQIMGRSNIQLASVPTFFDYFSPNMRMPFLLLSTLILFFLVFMFLKTRSGYILRACGENPHLLGKLGYNLNIFLIFALATANALTAMAGALASHYLGYADIGMGTGLIVASLAALILGETICTPRAGLRLVLAALVGSFLYRLAFEVGLRMHIHPWNLKIAVGGLLAVALIGKRLLSKHYRQLPVGVDSL